MNQKLRVWVGALGFMLLTPLYAESASITQETDKLSYTIGVDMGMGFKKQGLQVNPTLLLQGLQDALAGGELKMTQQEMQDTLQKFQKEMVAKKLTEFKDVSEKNKKSGELFLAENKKKEGVIALPSGLQYKVIKAGTGAQPGKTDSVTVEYTGTLLDGKVFDSTERTGKPVTFQLDRVIPGWTEALQLMKEGATWEIYVPSELAYGQRGIGGPIGPNETLIFKINLISVAKASKPS